VLPKNLIAVSDQALAKRRPAARTNANDDALRFGRTVGKYSPELQVQSFGATRRHATSGRSDLRIGDCENRSGDGESEREMSKHSFHAIYLRRENAAPPYRGSGTAGAVMKKAEQLRRQSRCRRQAGVKPLQTGVLRHYRQGVFRIADAFDLFRYCTVFRETIWNFI
jgi:hypothetical protein